MSFKRWALPTARLCCPVATPRVNPRTGHTAPLHGTIHTHGNMHQTMHINCTRPRASALLCQECTLLVRVQLTRKSANHPNFCICRFSEHSHVWCNDQLDTVYCSKGRSSTWSPWDCRVPGCRRITKDPCIAQCAFSDMNSNPSFSCKHVFKHSEDEWDCHMMHISTEKADTLRNSMLHVSQSNGGDARAQLVLYRLTRMQSMIETLDILEDPFWQERVEKLYVDGSRNRPQQASQGPVGDPRTQCAAAARMHGHLQMVSSKLEARRLPRYCRTSGMEASSANPACHMSQSRRRSHLNGETSGTWVSQIVLVVQGPYASFLHHCNTMESPYIPSYGRVSNE